MFSVVKNLPSHAQEIKQNCQIFRGRIVVQCEAGLSKRKITDFLQIPLAAVNRTRVRFKNKENNQQSLVPPADLGPRKESFAV